MGIIVRLTPTRLAAWSRIAMALALLGVMTLGEAQAASGGSLGNKVAALEKRLKAQSETLEVLKLRLEQLEKLIRSQNDPEKGGSPQFSPYDITYP